MLFNDSHFNLNANETSLRFLLPTNGAHAARKRRLHYVVGVIVVRMIDVVVVVVQNVMERSSSSPVAAAEDVNYRFLVDYDKITRSRLSLEVLTT